jgi:hypothetical protein
MRVVHGGRAVRRPARVRDPGRPDHAVALHERVELGDAIGAARALEAAVAPHGDTAAVVAAVLEPLQSLDQDRDDVPGADGRDDSAHGPSLPRPSCDFFLLSTFYAIILTRSVGAILLHMDLDAIDLRLLDQLQKDASLNNVELAGVRPRLARRPRCGACGASSDAGYVERTVALLSTDRLAPGLSAIVEVTLEPQTAQTLDAFESRATRDDACSSATAPRAGPTSCCSRPSPTCRRGTRSSRA